MVLFSVSVSVFLFFGRFSVKLTLALARTHTHARIHKHVRNERAKSIIRIVIIQYKFIPQKAKCAGHIRNFIRSRNCPLPPPNIENERVLMLMAIVGTASISWPSKKPTAFIEIIKKPTKTNSREKIGIIVLYLLCPFYWIIADQQTAVKSIITISSINNKCREEAPSNWLL